MKKIIFLVLIASQIIFSFFLYGHKFLINEDVSNEENFSNSSEVRGCGSLIKIVCYSFINNLKKIPDFSIKVVSKNEKKSSKQQIPIKVELFITEISSKLFDNFRYQNLLELKETLNIITLSHKVEKTHKLLDWIIFLNLFLIIFYYFNRPRSSIPDYLQNFVMLNNNPKVVILSQDSYLRVLFFWRSQKNNPPTVQWRI